MPVPDDAYISAILPDSFLSSSDSVDSSELKAHKRVSRRSVRWQAWSSRGSWATLTAVVAQKPGYRAASADELNRLLEIQGLGGAIGEQLGLAWIAEQDAQRIAMNRAGRGEEHQRMLHRAMAELAAYYTLGTFHSLGNLGVRAMLFDAAAASDIAKVWKKAAGFPPDSEDRHHWLTFGFKFANDLARSPVGHSNTYVQQIKDVLVDLAGNPAFDALDNRRGMDFHRRRPQSVAHSAPSTGLSTVGADGFHLDIVAATLAPEADAREVHRVSLEAMLAVTTAMTQLDKLIPKLIRSVGIQYANPSRPAKKAGEAVDSPQPAPPTSPNAS